MKFPNEILREDGLFTKTYYGISASFSVLMSYAKEANKLLEDKINKTRSNFEEQKSEEWYSKNKETIEYFNDKIMDAYQMHPFFLNHSAIILVSSYFENVLEGLLNDIHKVKQSEAFSIPRYPKQKFKEIKEISEIHHSQELDSQWQKVLKYYEIRNRIVHNFSSFKEVSNDWKKDEVYKFLSKNKYVLISEKTRSFRIHNYYFIIGMIQELQCFFLELCNELNDSSLANYSRK